jgi:hypothetical protein
VHVHQLIIERVRNVINQALPINQNALETVRSSACTRCAKASRDL